MMEWNEIKLEGVAKIERFVDEFEIWEFDKIPYGKFKVKIYETSDGKYIGRTNLMVIDKTGSYNAGVGFGYTVGDALADTISYFFSLIGELIDLSNDCFKYVDIMDF